MSAQTDRSPQAVLDVARALPGTGLVVGTAGNVSARLTDGTVSLTPSSLPYDELTVDDLVTVDLDGSRLAGHRSATSEQALHLACYRAHPEVGGVVHCHAPHASMFAVAHRAIPPVIEEVVVHLGGSVEVVPHATAGSEELGERVTRALTARSAVLLANHGLVSIGRSPAEALHAAVVAEHAARVVWGARSLGSVVPLPARVVEDLVGVYAYSRTTW